MKSWMNELKEYPNALFGIWNEPVLPAFGGGSSWTKDTFMNGYQQIIAGMRTISDHIIVVNIAWDASTSRPHMSYYQDSRLSGTNILFDIHVYESIWSDPSQNAMENVWRQVGLIDSPVPLILGELAPDQNRVWGSSEWVAAESILKIVKKYPINFCIEFWRWGQDYYHLLKETSNHRINLFGDGYTRWGKLCKEYLGTYTPPL
jgi:hypothetical protein